VAGLAALLTAFAAWISQGLLVWTGDGLGVLALLPLSTAPLTICVIAAVIVFLAVRRGGSLIPLTLLGLIVAAWAAGPLSPALALWSGRLVLLVWIAFVAALLASTPWRIAWSGRPRHGTAAVLAFLLTLVAWWQVSPQVPGGDEPHYLVITQSLLKDGDLRIENNHRRRDYLTYFGDELRPDFRVRGRDGQIYSIHAPGVPALVAPAFLLGGYAGVVLFLAALSALGAGLAWHLAWLVTNRSDAAWFGWASVTLSVTWIFHSFTVYPDGVGAVLLLTGAWALLRLEGAAEQQSDSVRPWLWHGAALALLPWLHSRFAVLAGGVGALVLLRMARVPNPLSKAFAFLIIPAASFLAWVAYFIQHYGTPNPAAPYGNEEVGLKFVPDGLTALFFDQRFGLFAYSPVLLLAVIGIGVMLLQPRWRRYALELLFVAVPYLVVVTVVAMWWGGRSAPARFVAPLLPWLAVPVAAAWASMTRRATRLTAAAALAFTAVASSVLIFAADGALAFNVRESSAQWLDWLNAGIDLPHALPAWARDANVSLYRGIVIWVAAGTAAWLALRWLETRRPRMSRSTAITVAAFAFAVAAAMAAKVCWAFERSSGYLAAAAQLEAIRMLAREPRVLALGGFPFERLDRSAAAASMRIEPARATAPGGAGRNDRPIFTLPALPAGEYRLLPTVGDSAGWVMVGIGRDQFAIDTVPVAEAQAGLTVRFPVAVRALILRGDEEARRSVRGLRLQIVALSPPASRLSKGYARHAVRYARTITYFLDDESYPEPEAFWVKGNTESEIVVQPDEDCEAESFLLRNGATENDVRIVTSGWRRDFHLHPGEEVQVAIPLNASAGATVVRFSTSAGFVPSAVDPDSRDNRHLGVWVKVGG
jgi:hypothetical protein